MNDFETCSFFLNSEQFRLTYPDYPLVALVIKRDPCGVPMEYSHTARVLVKNLVSTFRGHYDAVSKKYDSNGKEKYQTIKLDDGKVLSFDVCALYAMLAFSDSIVRDEFQVELTCGLVRLLNDEDDRLIYFSLCQSIYVLWNQSEILNSFQEDQLSKVDKLQNYLNGALWTYSEHVN